MVIMNFLSCLIICFVLGEREEANYNGIYLFNKRYGSSTKWFSYIMLWPQAVSCFGAFAINLVDMCNCLSLGLNRVTI